MDERDYKYLISKGFKVINQQQSDYFGDYYDILTSTNIELIFNSSKSYKSIDIRKSGDDGDGYDLYLVRALILNELNLKEQIKFESVKQFLENNLKSISKLFSDKNYNNTQKELEKLEKKRVKQMFPNAFD